jgi:hypothetical protein
MSAPTTEGSITGGTGAQDLLELRDVTVNYGGIQALTRSI